MCVVVGDPRHMALPCTWLPHTREVLFAGILFWNLNSGIWILDCESGILLCKMARCDAT